MNIFFFNDTATTEIYTLSLHDALPISSAWRPTPLKAVARLACTAALEGCSCAADPMSRRACCASPRAAMARPMRSEEHTSELQSQSNIVCRLLLEKKTESVVDGARSQS